jgi:hypothetical protein
MQGAPVIQFRAVHTITYPMLSTHAPATLDGGARSTRNTWVSLKLTGGAAACAVGW